ncbi:KTSC domain-containing protein [Pseudoduganella lurida]|uniref:KTSC domain-containing protein n=1 Tax=Pseudoduganella lurida TaxID=1036180 RepID=A0A562RIV6_9BURK|nr:KTSC domain-containing protein [Pseudoduganella lurida]TWI69022.1 KTSC domain-containing protein [Pseudoduganella lurida]
MPILHDIEMLPVDSSQIAAIGHSADSNTLAIQFKGRTGPGSVYHYQNFDAAAFEEFAAAESIGSHFYKHIKPHAAKYPYEKKADVIEVVDGADEEQPA